MKYETNRLGEICGTKLRLILLVTEKVAAGMNLPTSTFLERQERAIRRSLDAFHFSNVIFTVFPPPRLSLFAAICLSDMPLLLQPSRFLRLLFIVFVFISLFWLSGLWSLDQIRQCLHLRRCGIATLSAATHTDDYNAKTTIYLNATPPLPPGDDKEYVALCMAVKAQVEDLPEYFRHHYYHLGVRRFYIMDDGTDPPLSDAKGPGEWGIPDPAITFHYFNRSERQGSMQHAMYAHCHEWHGHQHKWFGFFDADEFLSMTSHHTPLSDGEREETLVSFLQTFDADPSVGAIALNWLMHTSSNLTHKPATGGVRANFRRCLDNAPDNEAIDDNNTVVKCFVKSSHFNGGGMHTFNLKNGSRHVGELGPGDDASVSLPWTRKPVTHTRIALHHFGFLSREHYAEKVQRGNAFDVQRTWSQWESVQNGSSVECEELAAYYP